MKEMDQTSTCLWNFTATAAWGWKRPFCTLPRALRSWYTIFEKVEEVGNRTRRPDEGRLG